MPWREAPRAPGPLLEAAGHLQLRRLPGRAGGTRQLPGTEPLIIHLPLMGSERSRARRLLEEPSGFYCRLKAGLVALTGPRRVSFLKPFSKPKSRGPRTGAARRDRRTPPSATQTSPPQRGRSQSCSPRSEPGGKDGISTNLGGISPERLFSAPPTPRCRRAALQAAALCRQTRRGGRGRYQYYNRDHRPFQLHCYFPIQSS